ncbi:MAG: hypothetical protein FD143_1836 [Ignavibacteria bacterium]|nr:MAG: hypothetical protein FD143_1836 [Ignavibacteria bacterium]KAF0157718.1 MAG: hypothetical protein FD188_2697 [Ignavibacteria bacterium]
MKALRISTLAIVIGILTLSSTLFASETEKEKVERILKNFLFALQFDNTGVVESAILNSMELKARYPEYDFKRVQDKLNALAIDGETPVIKYRAQLASLYYSNYTLFGNITFEDKENPERIFSAIIDRLEHIHLVSI